MADTLDESALTALLASALDRHGVPGGSLLVAVGDEVVCATHGIADVSSGEPVSADTRFSVASITKPMVATVVAYLAADGHVDLDDPVASHVPELADVAWAHAATVRQLLANTSGAPMAITTEWLAAGTGDTALAEHVATIGRGVPIGAPGGIWSYTNGGWCVLGRLVEVVTGRTWEAAMRELLLTPLGMAASGFAHEPPAEPRAAGHGTTGKGPAPTPMWGSRPLGPAGGTVFSTPADLLRFARHHLDGLPHLDSLRDPQATVEVAAFADEWCLGWAAFAWGGVRAWGWDGISPGQRAVLRLVPESNAVYALLTNGDRGRAVNRTLLAELGPVLGGPGCRVPALPLEPTPGAAGDLARFAGRYSWPDHEVVVTARDDVLVQRIHGNDRELAPIDATTFLADPDHPDSPTVTFAAFAPDGRPGVVYDTLWALPRVP